MMTNCEINLYTKLFYFQSIHLLCANTHKVQVFPYSDSCCSPFLAPVTGKCLWLQLLSCVGASYPGMQVFETLQKIQGELDNGAGMDFS